MASTVLSGSSNATYTNSTSQNVRLVINYMAAPTAMSWSATAGGTVSVTATGLISIGRNLAFYGQSRSENNASSINENGGSALPTEIMLAAGQTFSTTCGAYNIVIIPEAG
jgi:hypothetical protein